MTDGYVRRCFIAPRAADSALFNDNVAHLDGYAIVPIEDYVKLLPETKRTELQALLSPQSQYTSPPEPSA